MDGKGRWVDFVWLPPEQWCIDVEEDADPTDILVQRVCENLPVYCIVRVFLTMVGFGLMERGPPPVELDWITG